jgi:hypothetical protein
MSADPELRYLLDNIGGRLRRDPFTFIPSEGKEVLEAWSPRAP